MRWFLALLMVCSVYAGVALADNEGKGNSSAESGKSDDNGKNDDKGKNDDNRRDDEENRGKVVVCHDGKELEINSSALSGHLRHGDVQGECKEEEEVNIQMPPTPPSATAPIRMESLRRTTPSGPRPIHSSTD